MEKFRKRYNLSPQGYVPVVRSLGTKTSCSNTEGATPASRAVPTAGREVCMMKWGLVPSFAKRAEDYDVFKGGSSTFNTRVEGAAASALWRRLLDDRRCVLLLDGFFEWKTVGKTKTPMFIRHNDAYQGHTILSSDSVPGKSEVTDKLTADDGPKHAPLLLAALYDVWNEGWASGTKNPETDVETVSILTMAPDGTPMFDVHDRTPVFLTPETAAMWLASAKWSDVIDKVCAASQAHAQKQLSLYEVSPLVSNIKNESPDCILPKKDYDARQLSKGIGRFFQKKSSTTVGDGNCSEQTPPLKRKADESLETPATKAAKVIELD